MDMTSNLKKMAEFVQQMQQADADWESLTQSIQEDKRCLATLQARLDNFRLLFSLVPGKSARETPAMATQMELLEQQLALVGQRILLQRARRNVLERRFDEIRLARATLRRASQKPPSRLVRAGRFAFSCVKRPLRGFWVFLSRPENYGEIMPNDLSLHQRASTGS